MSSSTDPKLEEEKISKAEENAESLSETPKTIFRTKRSYMPVDVDKRQKLIKAVEEEGMTIKVASHNLKINYSTAKHIVKLYKRTG